MNDVKQLTINAIRVLSAEAIQKANSGHPGMPLGAAPIGYAAFTNMTFNPKNTAFDNRDRFVLSAGHASMLDYSLYYLFGFGLTKDDIMNFRQLGSRTEGHPEYKVCPGVETSTGPLGQGVANAVGMAIAENYLASKFNKEGFPIVDHYTIALCGDGCMQEGIENEAASLAGSLKLGKLIVLYDDNDITIEGSTDITFNEDVGKRHEALGWQVIKVKDANDVAAINRAIKKAKAEKEKLYKTRLKKTPYIEMPIRKIGKTETSDTAWQEAYSRLIAKAGCRTMITTGSIVTMEDARNTLGSICRKVYATVPGPAETYIPAGEYAYMFFRGALSSLNEFYASFLKAIDDEGLITTGDIYEELTISSIVTRDEKEHVTKLFVRISE